MPLNILNKSGYKLGKGWRLDPNALPGDGILTQEPSHDRNSILWYLTKYKITATIPSPPAINIVGSIVDHARRRLIYFREQGIACYNFIEENEKLLIPLDTNLFRVREFWLDSEEDTLYFIRQKYSPSWKALLARLGKQKATGMKVQHSLIRYSFETGLSRVIIDFDVNYQGGVVDARRGVIYTQSGQKISVIDLYSGRTLKELPEPNISKLSPAPGGKTLVWGLYSPVAYKISPDGTKTATDFVGVSPSFSDDGKKLAFWDRLGAFHVTGKRGESDCALFLSSPGSVDVIRFQQALWSPCNKHIALPLSIPLSADRSETVLCVLNVEEKTLTLCSHNVLNFGFAPGECNL